jgi:hypothetical protein
MDLRFHPDALEELYAAIARLESEHPGVGSLLLDTVEAQVQRAARLPQSGARVPGFPEPLNVRRFVVRRFRYAIVTALVAGVPTVIALAHTSREPGYWRRRLDAG